MSLWSGRFDSAPDKQVFDYGKSLSIDKRLAEDDITGSQAWAEALGRAGVLSGDDVSAIVGGLDAIRKDIRTKPAVFDDAPDEDIHSFVERKLVFGRMADSGRRLLPLLC